MKKKSLLFGFLHLSKLDFGILLFQFDKLVILFKKKRVNELNRLSCLKLILVILAKLEK